MGEGILCFDVFKNLVEYYVEIATNTPGISVVKDQFGKDGYVSRCGRVLNVFL